MDKRRRRLGAETSISASNYCSGVISAAQATQEMVHTRPPGVKRLADTFGGAAKSGFPLRAEFSPAASSLTR